MGDIVPVGIISLAADVRDGETDEIAAGTYQIIADGSDLKIVALKEHASATANDWEVDSSHSTFGSEAVLNADQIAELKALNGTSTENNLIVDGASMYQIVVSDPDIVPV